VLVDRHEPLDRLRDAVDLLPAQARERDDSVGRDRPAREGEQLAVADRDRRDTADEEDARLVEQAADGLARRVAEELERLGLGRDHAQLDAVAPDRRQMRGRHERELVGRQRPGRSPWHREGDPAHVAPLELLEELAHQGCVSRAAEGQRTRHRRLGHCPAGEEQRVVTQDGVASRPGLTAVDVDAREGSERDEGADTVRQLAEVEVPDLAEVERLGDGHGPVPEARFGREELDADLSLSELAERESCFERRHAAAGDQDRERVSFHASMVRGGRTSVIGERACSRPGFYGSARRAAGGAVTTGRRAAPDSDRPGRLSAGTRSGRRCQRSAARSSRGTRPLVAVAGRDLRALGGRRSSCHIPGPVRAFVHRARDELSANCGRNGTAFHTLPTGAGAAWG
jgi:hypothetical protein